MLSYGSWVSGNQTRKKLEPICAGPINSGKNKKTYVYFSEHFLGRPTKHIENLIASNDRHPDKNVLSDNSF